MPRLARPLALTALTALAALLPAGCGSVGDTAAGDADALFQQRAQQVVGAWSEADLLERWRTAVVPAQGLTVEPDWAPRGTLKAAFYGGWVRTATALPTAPGTGEVRYADGTVVPVRTLDAQAAYDGMVNPRSGPCPTPEDGRGTCDWVTVTAVKPATTTISTARGPAEVPAWAFTVQGLRQAIVRVSVDGAMEPSDFEPKGLPSAPSDGRRILLFGQDVVSHTDTSLTVTLGSGDCDTDLRPHVVDTRDVVVVGGTALGPSPDQACNAMLRLQEVTVPLRQPVADRPVLDAASGRPLLPKVQPVP
jgi:hypothetical protein